MDCKSGTPPAYISHSSTFQSQSKGMLQAEFKNKSITTSNVYTHIELGAGNKIGQIGPEYDQKYIHDRNCKCIGCDYEFGEFRFKVLTLTIDSIVKENKNKKLKIYLNDIEPVSLNQAESFLKQYLKKNYKDNHDIEVGILLGDCFDINYRELNPNSVHLKNPEVGFLKKISENFDSTIYRILKGCEKCDDTGLIIVLVDNTCHNPKGFDLTFRGKVQATNHYLDYDPGYRYSGYLTIPADDPHSEYVTYLLRVKR